MPIRAISIDDDPMSLLMVRKLADQSPQLDLVNTYEDPVKGAAGIILDQPDLLFLDMEMPDFNGLQIMSALKRPPKIIVISANPHFRERAMELNAEAFLQKPVEIRDFNEAVSKVVYKLRLEHMLQ